MPNNKNDIRSKLNVLNRSDLNTAAYELGIKGCEKQERDELVESILSIPEEMVLRQLNKSDELPDAPLSLELNLLDRIVLNVVAHDLGIKHDQEEKADLVKAILENRERGAILKELENDWNGLFLKLSPLDRVVLNVIAHDLGIKNYSQEDRHELIENIMSRKKEDILKELGNKWDETFLRLNELDEDKLNAVARKLGIKDYSKQERQQLIENILKNRDKTAIVKLLNKWDINIIGNLSSIIGLPVGITSIILSIILGFLFTIYSEDIQMWWKSESPGERSAETTIPPIPIPSSSTSENGKQESYDSLTINEAERFYFSVRNAPIATYDAGKLPPGFDKTPEIEYEGELKAGSDGKITGEMKFFHKKSGNIFMLNSDGAVSPRNGDEWTEPLTGMEFVWIRGDCYDMGCDKVHCEKWEKPVHQVCVKGFWMGKQEVTQGQWKTVTGDNSTVGEDDAPVHNVSWDDAARFISKLNELTEKTGKTYRLPREAEWEYACKKGVGTDNMKSGVREWCADIFGSYTGNQDNNSRFKVVRGGNYRPKESVRCSYRIGKLSDVQKDDIGFRLVSNESD